MLVGVMGTCVPGSYTNPGVARRYIETGSVRR
jgi:hypothetical protein